MIRAVIFDMDGVMFNTEELFQEVHIGFAKKRNKQFTIDIKNKMMGRRAFEATTIFLKELGIEEDIHSVVKEQTFSYKSLLSTKATPLDGLHSLLKFLDQHRIRKAIATSSLKEWVDILLTKFNLKGHFEAVITGDMISKGKPDPEIYLKTISSLKLYPDECLVIEDALNGVRAGTSAGCQVIAVPNQFTAHQDFSIANLIVESLEDKRLFNFIEQQVNA